MLYINSNYTNLGYNIYTTILKNHMQKPLDAIIGENQSVANKNRWKQYYTHCPRFEM